MTLDQLAPRYSAFFLLCASVGITGVPWTDGSAPSRFLSTVPRLFHRVRAHRSSEALQEEVLTPRRCRGTPARAELRQGGDPSLLIAWK